MREKMWARLEWHIGGVNRESGFCFSFLSCPFTSWQLVRHLSRSWLEEGSKTVVIL
jgi:hypothetical protein